MSPARPRTDLVSGDHRAQRHSTGDAFRDTKNIRFDSPMLAGEHLAGAAKTRLNFVSDQQDPVAPAEILKHRQIFGRGHDVTSFTLNRLDKNSGHFVGHHFIAEEFFQSAEAFDPVWNMMNSGNQRRKLRAMRSAARRER